MPSRKSTLSGVALIFALGAASPGARAQAPAGGPAFSPARAQALLGPTTAFRFFALESRLPAAWSKSSYAAASDPNHLTRLQWEDRQVPTGWSLGRQQYFKHPVFVELWLRSPVAARGAGAAQRRAALEAYAKGRLKGRLVTGHAAGWAVGWQPSRYQEHALDRRRRLGVLMLVGAARPSPYVAPLAVSLVAVLLVEGPHAAVLATGLASDHRFTGLEAAAQQRVVQGVTAMAAQLTAVAALGRIRLPGRHPALERQLSARGRFLHASRWSSRLGTVSTTSVAEYRRLDIRFLPGRRCTVRDDFSALYAHTQRSLLDAPGSAPRSQTQGAGAGRRVTPPSPWEVRRGTGGAHWLVIYLPASHGGPTFYKVEPSASKRCGRKTIRGLAIGGQVEGVYSTVRGWCVYRPAARARLP